MSDVVSEARDTIAWAHRAFGDGLVLAASFSDCVLIDLAVSVAPRIEVLFCDTGFHFRETLDYVEQLRSRFDLNLRVLEPIVDLHTSPCGTGDCCQVRKVEPLRRALSGKAAWLTGLRRVESPERAGTPVVGWDERNGLTKIAPLAAWSDGDVEAYVSDRRLPVHPLTGAGYISIGCAPTTVPVTAGADPRSGRWPGEDKTECGLHV